MSDHHAPIGQGVDQLLNRVAKNRAKPVALLDRARVRERLLALAQRTSRDRWNEALAVAMQAANNPHGPLKGQIVEFMRAQLGNELARSSQSEEPISDAEHEKIFSSIGADRAASAARAGGDDIGA